MNRLLSLTILIILICRTTSEDPNVPPFCHLCACENNDSNQFDVTCTKDIKEYLFDTYYWINKDNNESYSYDQLSIQNTPILTLDKQFPASSIKMLNLAKNSIVNISDNIFSNLQSMEILVLSFNNIELLHPDAFKGLYLEGDFMPLRALKILKLDHNRIHSLDGDIFEHTSRIETLSLSHNPLKVIDQQTTIAITSLVYLKDLDLSYTEIAVLPDHFMHTPKYITTLDLSGNLFDRIPEGLGESHNLEALYLNDNPITNITSQNGFPNITTLKSLHMRNMNELHNISEGALSKLENLEELYLYDNSKLCHLDTSALTAKRNGAEYETWPPIKKLFLQNNKLASIDMHLLLNWKGLTNLDLTNNPWTCECENQWMIDELMPIYLQIDEFKAKSLRCGAPVEMVEASFFDLYEKHSTMRCLDLYGHRPERDGTMLIGVLAGVLLTIPLVLFLIYAYQRNWFGVFDGSPASFSRQFYKRTESSDEYI